MPRRVTRLLVPLTIVASLLLDGAAAIADHTDPRNRLASTQPGSYAGSPIIEGAGSWQHLRNFRANPGTDFEFFNVRGALYASAGTLGQANAEHVGQRILQLLDRNGNLAVDWVADHGSANCPTANPRGTTGLQHDTQIAYVPGRRPRLMTDTTDATGRCHDPDGGGIELVDVTDIHKPDYRPREIGIIRFAGFSHTHTVDQQRPWIIYNSSSDFSGRPWIEVVDVRSCLKRRKLNLEQQRDRCRPVVFRIPFQPEWTRQRNSATGQLHVGSEAACHDITSEGTRVYCAGLNASLVFDVKDLVQPRKKKGGKGKDGPKKGKGRRKLKPGPVRGQALPCTVRPGTRTGAMVTDCSGVPALQPNNPGPQAEGWQFLGTFNHPGRDCQPGAGITPDCNGNTEVRSDMGVAVAHEADPTWDGRHMFVTDERGGGVVPPGASCQPGLANPYGNGGIHVFDITQPGNFQYALKDGGGGPAVWIGDANVPAPDLCTVHVIEKIPGEQRLIVAYYSQGTKIVDYWVDAEGQWHFRETASVIWPQAATWATEDFKIIDNADGTRTYYFLSSDITRGIDVFSWTGPTNPIGSAPPARLTDGATRAANVGLLGLAVLGLPVAAAFGRRRRRARR